MVGIYYRNKMSGDINTEEEYKEIMKKDAWVEWDNMNEKERKEEYDNDFEKIIKHYYESNNTYEAGVICKDCNEFIGFKKDQERSMLDEANHYICPNCSD